MLAMSMSELVTDEEDKDDESEVKSEMRQRQRVSQDSLFEYG